MRTLDLSLYLVLDPVLCGGQDGMVKTAIAAAENGATIMQLRAEAMEKRAWYEAGLALKEALRPYEIPLIVNDHIDVALAIDADGVHIGQKDLPAEIVRSMIGRTKWLGLSVSNSEQLEAVPDVLDYLGIGPVYPTQSKRNAPPAIGLGTLAELTQNKCQPAVGIGGITAATVSDVLQCGVEGVAVVSAICGQPFPAQATKALRDEVDNVQ
jgi:thiamine-phosphate pyrophosphorylase